MGFVKLKTKEAAKKAGEGMMGAGVGVVQLGLGGLNKVCFIF
jgi:hypothetical protein